MNIKNFFSEESFTTKHSKIYPGKMLCYDMAESNLIRLKRVMSPGIPKQLSLFNEPFDMCCCFMWGL